LPTYTVLTHAHWDHSYGLWATATISLCGKKTWDKINEMTKWEWTEEAMNHRLQTGEEIPFCHENILKEYAGLNEIHVVTPDISFDKELTLHLGNVTVRAIETENPHEEDGVLIAVDDLLILGDSSSPDYYHLNEKYDRTRLASYLAQLNTYKGYRLVHSHIDEILPLKQYIRMVEENASETGYVQ
ncbi:MAG: hypothetical protein HUJ58_06140, partial [Erysipelotrichaceae bacterium]|nr:hypothetical protein [Erysipelotrichaceae bacterium]